MIVAWKINDQVFIGHSLCDKYDRYNKDVAYNIAVNRGMKHFDSTDYIIPHSIRKEFDETLVRARRYFKDSSYPTWMNDGE